MNKQELIKEFEEIGIHGLNMFGTVVKDIPAETAITLIKQLDEPEKAVVKPFVAGWYEKNKGNFEANLLLFINRIFSISDGAKLNDFERWFLNASTKPFQTLVNMHQFGYEVEKEERYYVRFKWIEESYSYLTLIKHLSAWTLKNITLDKKFRTAHTRKELEEAGFGWVFDCPGVQIEEVEE